NEATFDAITPGTPRDVSQFIYDIPKPWDPQQERSRENAGSIRLLAAGDIYSDNYWRVIWSPLWHQLFTLDDDYAHGRTSEHNYLKLLGILLGIKKAIAQLTPRPDYMIVDLRCGASELATTIIGAWVDTLVYTFSFNED